MLKNWIERLFAKVTSSSTRPLRACRRGHRPIRPGQMQRIAGQSLEDRVLLANFNPLAATADGDPGSLRDAITVANFNGQADVITLEAGTYLLTAANPFDNSESANAGGDLDIRADGGNSLTIRGQGAGVTIIEQSITDRVFEVFGANVTFENLTITGGEATSTDGNFVDLGGGILSSGNLTLTNVQVSDNVAHAGGGILSFFAGTVTATGSTFAGNRASGGSGGGSFEGLFDNQGGGIFVASGGTVSLTDSTVDNNEADSHGGGIAAFGSTVTLANTTLNSNFAGVPNPDLPVVGNGGGLFIASVDLDPEVAVAASTVNITGGTIFDNIGFSGGGIWNGAGNTLTIDGTQIQDNAADNPDGTNAGGGIFNLGSTLSVANATITGNRADNGDRVGNGGGIAVFASTVTLTSSTLDDNVAGQDQSGIGNGGGLYIGSVDSEQQIGPSTVTINGGTVQDNSAQNDGGGIWNGAGNTLTIDGSTISGNTAGDDGGGVDSVSDPTNATTTNIFNSYVGLNTAADNGGGIRNANESTLNLFNVFIDRNIASGTGGGGIFNNGGAVNVSTMFVAGNQANGVNGFGGGLLTIDADDQGGVIFGNVTIQNNSATFGGGVASVDGTLAVDNSAVLNNTANDAQSFGLGGGIYVGGSTASVGVTGTDVAGNTAGFAGGGIANQGANNVAVFGSFVQNNTAGTFGGGLFNDGGSVFFDFSIVQNNTTEGFGGGVANFTGAVGFNSSAVFANSAAVFGGGIYNNASLFFSGGQLTNNNAALGGGLFDDVGGAPFLDGVFASGNLPDDIFDI